MKKKINNKVVLIIELVLIIACLVLACIGAIDAIKTNSPGSEPVAADGSTPPEGEPQQQGEAPDLPETTDGTESQPAPVEGEAPAENAAPINNPNMSEETRTAFSYIITNIVPILVYVLLLVYVLIEYKRPHGNLLRITLLIYSFMLVIWASSQGENAGCVYILPCATVIVSYLSGRLNKYKRNIVWFAIAAALLIGYGILQTVMVLQTTSTDGSSYGILQFSYCFGSALQLLTLALAYFGRYEEHKEAGLAEAQNVTDVNV